MTIQEEDKEHASLFRSTAIEHAGNTEQFEQFFQPIAYKRKITYIGLASLFVGGLIWLFFGSIPIEVKGVGIAVDSRGLSNIKTSFSGIVKDLHVQIGDSVKKGDIIATLYNPEIETRLQEGEKSIKKLQQRLMLLRRQVDFEGQKNRKAIEESVRASKFKTQSLEKEIPVLKNDVANKEDLARQGLFDSNSLQASKELLWSKQIELEKTQANLYQLQFFLKKEYRENEIEAIQQQLLDAMQKQSLLKTHLQYANIYSPINGTMEEWFIQKGKYVIQGELIARLEHQEKNEWPSKIFYGYVPLEKGKKIRLNTEVAIELTTVKPSEYGVLFGNITYISQHAVSPENLLHKVHNQALLHFFIQNQEAILEVSIEPQKDPNTISGYRWSSGKGPPIQLESGTLCHFRAVIEEVRPFFYFIPTSWVKDYISNFHLATNLNYYGSNE